MVLVRKQNVFMSNKSHLITIPVPWFEKNVLDITKPVSIIGLDCLLILPQRPLSTEQIRKMCDDLSKLIPMEQEGEICEPSGT
jgi:hypothetical protein